MKIMKVIKWRCKKCKDVVTSGPDIHLNVKWCKCGECGVDADELLVRVIGDVEFLEKN